MAIKLSARVELRMTPAEKLKCEERARAARMTVSEWIRRRLLLDMAKPENPPTSIINKTD